ncbi:MAG: anhydro-N-acetylmuramic acid kinase [Sulfurovaceae bacterium]|nr:anhydro-N-acetylmuramic acid kinase [Sulfurovaceae bacterium]
MSELYIGVMSGTSLDGIDIALCQIDAKQCTLIEAVEYPFPKELKERVLEMIAGQTTLQEVGELDSMLGSQFAGAINEFIISHDIDKQNIKAIGVHGQTLWHAPSGKYPTSMQLGDPNIINARCGIPIVADFRRKDVACGGQGAPFAPAFHAFLFGNIDHKIAVVNIGGMANITVLGEKTIGYDTGCGNVLLDIWIAKHQGKSYDKDGVWAQTGKVDYALLDEMLSDDYFEQEHPKSTGREKFNEAWLEDKLLRHSGLDPESKEILKQVQDDKQLQANVQRTLLELTAISISNEVLKFHRDMVLLCGGGAKNSFLVERIRAMMPNVEVLVAQHGDMLEAMMIAWLAYKRLHKEPVDLKDVTGAKVNAILGGLYE